MSFTNLRIPLLGTWQKTCAAIANTIQKVGFCTEESFIWNSWNPIITASGTMTYSGLSFRIARYCKVGNLAFIRMFFQLTPVAPLSNAFIVPLPFTTADQSSVPGGADQQGGSVIIYPGGPFEIGNWEVYPSASNLLYISRPAGINYTAAGYTFEFNGTLEVQ